MSKLKVYPVKFEGYGECDELVFTAEVFESGRASIEIEVTVDAESWPNISSEIQKCLDAMRLEDE